MKALYFLLISIVSFASCNGQSANPLHAPAGQPKLSKYPDSSPYDNVGCGIQDRAGNLWFGTSRQGVYRYDGNSFVNFTTKDGLGSDGVSCILEDKDGNIWIGTNAGACRYNGKIFTNVSLSNGAGYLVSMNPTGSQPSQKNKVINMLQDKSGKIWLGTGSGVYYYDGNTFKRFLQDDGVINKNKLVLNSVQGMIEDRNGNIWFTTWFEGLCRYDGKEIINFKPNNEVWYAPIHEDRNGNIWAGRRGKGVVRYDGKAFTNLVQGGVFDRCGVMAIAEDKQGNMWFGTEADDMTMRETIGGVWRYDGKAFQNFTQKDGVGNYSVFCLLADRSGSIWAGTRNMGLYRYNGKGFVALSE